jgi:hypothetical protein
VTPAAVDIDYPALLDAPAPHLRAYPVETVVAEKFEAMVTLGIANSRLKDFYDLWLIAQTFEFRRSILIEAVRRTFELRQTALPTDTPVGLSDEFAMAWSTQWQAFLRRERMAAATETFTAVVVDLRLFLLPLVDAEIDERMWLPGGPWSKCRISAKIGRTRGTAISFRECYRPHTPNPRSNCAPGASQTPQGA